MDDLVARARRFATSTHRRIDQRRKYSFQPYEIHLRSVAEIVASVTDDPETIAAAWLHDTVEDTPVTRDDIERGFGPGIAWLVDELTDVSRPSDGNRATRKAIDRKRLARASARAKTVKLADLIDNARDICRNDPRFGRVFLDEMAASMEVLGEGDARLLTRARRELERWRETLASTPVDDLPPPSPDDGLRASRPLRQFAHAFSAQDVAEPLRSFDSTSPVSAATMVMKNGGLTVVGVRLGGRVDGYLPLEIGDVADGTCGDAMRLFARDQVIDGGATLSEVIHVLTRRDHCFVRLLHDDIGGVVTRSDMQKPVVRMWLFGIVTFVEMNVTERIRAVWPDGAWTVHLTPSRLAKARKLQEERLRRGQTCDLLDCLQFSDRAGVLMVDEGQRTEFGFPSRAVARRVLKEIESLRNNLAHAQDIVTHDWAQIARLARRIEALADDEA